MPRDRIAHLQRVQVQDAVEEREELFRLFVRKLMVEALDDLAGAGKPARLAVDGRGFSETRRQPSGKGIG